MTAWRILASSVLVFVAACGARAQTYTLAETPRAGDCFQIQLDMKLRGEIRVRKDDRWIALPLQARAQHVFPERILDMGLLGLPQRVARYYETAHAVIQRGKETSERSLRAERRLLVADHGKDPFLVYCPAGSLTRQELELTSEHFDTLALLGILPGKAVAVGDTWKIPNTVVQALCGFEGLTAQDLTGKLVQVENQIAQITVTGTASGIDTGALVKVTVEVSGSFDLSSKHLTSLSWKQKDERDQGPASPASTVETTTTLQRSLVDLPTTLSDVALISVPEKGAEVPASMVQLGYDDPKSRFELTYARGWQVVGQTDERLVLRLMDRGDLVAQATITPWPAAKAGEHMTADAFREQMGATPGWEDESDQPDAGSARTDERGYWIYHFTAVGRMDGVPVMQIFYLVSGPEGQQTVVVITLNRNEAEKLGSRDVTLVSGLHYPAKQSAP
ncbi:MAG TPA: hypothetical protein VFA18_18705 [Gemmataceae bacterium]|nr:hypothetical protein [Gemmataceae bacterium]